MGKFKGIVAVSLFTMASDSYAKVSSIEISGLKRTRQEVVLNELTFQVGGDVSEEEIDRSKQNLYNLRLFYEVDMAIESQDSSADEKVLVHLKERWTTIPIVKFSNGGGVTQLTLGTYDINLFGRYLEGGLQFEKLGDSTAGVVWYRDPRLLGQKLRLSIDLWKVDRIHTLYQDKGRSKDKEHAFLQTKRKFNLGLERSLTSTFSASVFTEFNDDEFSRKFLSDEILEISHKNALPERELTQMVGLGVRWGQLNHTPWRVLGHELSARGAFSQHHFENSKTKGRYRAYLEYKWYEPLPMNATLAFKLSSETTNAESFAHQIYAGGLNRIRGFLDNRFSGNGMVLSNLEYRIPSYQSGGLIVQHVFFADAVRIGELTKKSGQINEAASAGLGLRLMSPRIYRLVGRLDFARSLKGDGTLPISFGVQQFF